MRKVSVLTKKQLKVLEKKLPEWKLLSHDTVLKRVVLIDTYVSGLTLIARIVVHAEVLDHHPSLTLEDDKLLIETTTHSLGGISARDVALAQAIDTVLDR